MGRKVDLNASKKSNGNGYKKIRTNRSFSYGNSSNYDDIDEVKDDNVSNLRQRAIEKGLTMSGVPKPLANMTSKNMDNYTARGSINFALPPIKNILIICIILLFFVGIMMFVVLFYDENAMGSNSYMNLVKACRRVNVVDTDCDSNGNNCSNSYSAEVSFDDYIAGVVAAIGNGANSKEFYKAIAVVARTYFFANADDSCEVPGNSTFMHYIDVSLASDKDMILEAVADTKSVILTVDGEKLVDASYSMACVVNNANDIYYLRYGMNESKYQQIPISFDIGDQIYHGILGSLYDTVDKSNANYEDRSCPTGNSSDGLSLAGALYLAKDQLYNYSDILKYYFGDVTESKAEELFVGNVVDGFINPVNPFPCLSYGGTKKSCTSSFGCRLHPTQNVYKWHGGMDIPVGEGTTVYAVKDGVVSDIIKNIPGTIRGSGSYGNYVLINHGDGTMSRYAHLKFGGIMVSVGDTVVQGQAIALSGNTGDSTGAHLHYEIYNDGQMVDPYNYLDTSVICAPETCNFGVSVAPSYCGR